MRQARLGVTCIDRSRQNAATAAAQDGEASQNGEASMTLPRGAVMLAVSLMLPLASRTAGAQQPEPHRVEKLIADGWDIGGYIAVDYNRSVILFKHREHHYLVQCSVLIDVMRNPRVLTYCYEIR
jgi:hypothetical protein